MTRTEFRKVARKVVALGEIAASFTPTNKDDQVVSLLGSVINEDDKFDELCDILGLPPDTP